MEKGHQCGLRRWLSQAKQRPLQEGNVHFWHLQDWKRPCPDDAIHFSDDDLEEIFHPHEDPLLTKADIKVTVQVTKVMVDPESYVNDLYHGAFKKMGYKIVNLAPFKEVFYDFTNTPMLVADGINLKVSQRAKKTRVSKIAQFVVVKLDSSYNTLFGWPTVHKFKAVPPSYHQCMRYPTKDGSIITIQGSSNISRRLQKRNHIDHLGSTCSGKRKDYPYDATKPINIGGGSVTIGT